MARAWGWLDLLDAASSTRHLSVASTARTGVRESEDGGSRSSSAMRLYPDVRCESRLSEGEGAVLEVIDFYGREHGDDCIL